MLCPYAKYLSMNLVSGKSPTEPEEAHLPGADSHSGTLWSLLLKALLRGGRSIYVKFKSVLIISTICIVINFHVNTNSNDLIFSQIT